MTLQTQAVLRVLLDRAQDEHYGFEVAKAAGLPTGSLYPILARLEKAGWLSSAWEDLDERAAGRRRRRYYKLTPNGLIWAEQSLADTVERLSPQSGTALRPGWAGGR